MPFHDIITLHLLYFVYIRLRACFGQAEILVSFYYILYDMQLLFCAMFVVALFSLALLLFLHLSLMDECGCVYMSGGCVAAAYNVITIAHFYSYKQSLNVYFGKS